jgi:hypothetical protein
LSGVALRVRLALAGGLSLFAVALGVVLLHSPLTVAGTNGVPARFAVEHIQGRDGGCQRVETVPAGTTAIRVSLSANVGPWVELRVLSGSRLVSEGERDAGWGVDETVTVPVRRVQGVLHGAMICTTVGSAIEPVQVNGSWMRLPHNRRVVQLRMEYLRPGGGSWLSLASSAARRMGLARAPGGAWVAYLAIALMFAVCVLSSRLVLREAGGARSARLRRSLSAGRLPARPGRVLRRVPHAAWTCALVASVSAVCWSLITPPFQATDEPSHFAYVQHLAETGTLPSYQAPFSQEEQAVLAGLRQPAVEWHPEVATISSRSALARLRGDLTRPLSRSTPPGAGVAASQPPLYYELQTIPYDLGSAGTLLDQLELMRLLSALMAGFTALFVFLFVRESLPAVPWAWTVGGLGAALFALLGFTSGAVTPDAMLFSVSAAVFYCLARAFRRGLTRGLALAIGALTAVGFLTKLNFIGLAPGVMLGLIILAIRASRSTQGANGHGDAFGSLAIAMVIAVSPVCAYILRNLLTHHPLPSIISGTAAQARRNGSIVNDVAYMWQLYLPRMPGMPNYFPGISTTRELWFDRIVGLYGWLDASFPVWVDNLALIPAGLIAILALRTLLAKRIALRARLPELAVYLVITAGLLALIAQASHMNRLSEGVAYAQPRYLLPLLPLAAGILTLAARGAGKRWGPAVGTLIVIMLIAHDIFSQLLIVSRYYT